VLGRIARKFLQPSQALYNGIDDIFVLSVWELGELALDFSPDKSVGRKTYIASVE